MKPALVILPSPGIGHLVSTIELAKRLNEHNSFSVTILVTNFSLIPTSSYESSIAASGLDISFLHLPPVALTSAESHSPEAFISLFIANHEPHVKDFLSQLRSSSRVAALVVDFFATTMIGVAKSLDIPTYLYFTSGAAFLALMLYLPTLDEKMNSEFEELEGEVEVPGMRPLPPSVMPSPLMSRASDGYYWFVSHGREIRFVEGIILNTFQELEPTLMEALVKGQCLPDYPTPKIYPVGPVLMLDDDDQGHKTNPCIRWLDNQPPASVIFLCFGSMGVLPAPQVREVALGLERSGIRFLWSLRDRPEGRFRPPVDADLETLLPEGFLSRTRDQGLVWPTWVPQKAILSHEAVGGFVSHCGWNSCLESLWFGVPILTWPLFAEQRLNGFQMVREMGVAVELKMENRGEGLVNGEEVERGVRCLMGDSRVRERAGEIKEATRSAVEKGGSSFESLKRLAQQLLLV